MESLLFLVHRIPYPPNKGDKIRSFHLLQYLAQYFDIYLCAFVDDPRDWSHQDSLQALCAQVQLRPLVPRRAKLRSARGLLSNQALTLPYYFDRGLQRWVNETIEAKGIRHCVIYSSAMAQYLTGAAYDGLSRIADLVDMDSDKWRQYSDSLGFPMSWVYRREARQLARFERRIVRDFDAVFFVSEDELKVFNSTIDAGLAANASPQPVQAGAALDYYNNGVDDRYFDPALDFANPYEAGDKVMVFTGAMDYWANVDAVKWFVAEVLPVICETQPTAKFYIVGANPNDEVRALAEVKNVRVTGMVEDIRPYICHAHFAVAPLRIARGVQNKVLEAMAMARQVVATAAAMEGIAHCDAYRPIVAEGATDFAEACCRLLATPPENMDAPAARRCIQAHYNWEQNLGRLGRYLGVPRAAKAQPEAAGG